MSDDTSKSNALPDPDDFDADAHFSDEELEAALAGFEQEFRQSDSASSQDDGGSHGDETAAHSDDDATDGSLQGSDDGYAAQDRTDLSSQFEDELAGLLGNKAKVAVMITRVASADLLAAFCQLADITADCIESSSGAIAALSNLDGDGPEAAARDLTTVVSGMTAILAVNRADKLEANLYLQGKSVRSFAPPVLFSATPTFVEDLMLGISDLDALRGQGMTMVSSSGLSHDDALRIVSEHTRFGRSGSDIQ